MEAGSIVSQQRYKIGDILLNKEGDVERHYLIFETAPANDAEPVYELLSLEEGWTEIWYSNWVDNSTEWEKAAYCISTSLNVLSLRLVIS